MEVISDILTDLIYNTATDGYHGDGYVLVTGSLPISTSSKVLLMKLMVENITGATVWAQIFDGYAQPTSLSQPICEVQVATGTQVITSWAAEGGILCKKGIVVAISTERGAYVAASSAAWMSIFWRTQ